MRGRLDRPEAIVLAVISDAGFVLRGGNVTLSFTQVDVEAFWYTELRSLHDRIFQSEGSDTISEELLSRPRFHIGVAFSEDRVVGYKIGYQDRKHRFYSWLGGVDALCRGRGIASQLMRLQHVWCAEQGYRVVRTQTNNRWRDMLILNLHHGFDIVGTYTDERGESKIILEKRL